MKPILYALVALAAFVALPSKAQTPCQAIGEILVCTGVGVNDEDALFTTNDVSAYDACMLMSSQGTVDVEGSLDGSNYSTALALEQRGAVSTDKVLITTAGVMFNVVGKYRRLRVRQEGSAAAATLLCWDRSR